MSPRELFVLTDYFPLVETAHFRPCQMNCQTAADLAPGMGQISPISGPDLVNLGQIGASINFYVGFHDARISQVSKFRNVDRST